VNRFSPQIRYDLRNPSRLSELPRRPDVEPEQAPAPTPSLWLYTLLTLAGSLMLVMALQNGAKIADILVNLGTGLLAAVVILILVDRRLRRSELAAIRGIPHSLKVQLFLLNPFERQIYRYTEAFLASALPRLKNVTARPELDTPERLIDTGLLLLGNPGAGKTTWLQSIAAQRADLFIRNPKEKKSPILFPMRSWLPDRTLVEVLHEHMARFARIKMRTFRRGMSKGRFLLILDGVDEATIPYYVLSSEFEDLRKRFPNTPLTISSRPDRTVPTWSGLAIHNMSPPTAAEIAEFKLRMGL
jgi:hypothetical protein